MKQKSIFAPIRLAPSVHALSNEKLLSCADRLGRWRKLISSFLLGTATITLSACSGGTGGGPPVSSAPPQAPLAPTPTSSFNDTSVELLQSPPSGELAAFTTGDSIRIRYDASANQYQVMAAGQDWTALVDNPASTNSPNLQFILASDPSGESSFYVNMHHRSPAETSRYRYSNLASWRFTIPSPTGDTVRRGTTAFGTATPGRARAGGRYGDL